MAILSPHSMLLIGIIIVFLVVCVVRTVWDAVHHRTAPHCQTPGNQDMYGIGIRIVIYLQLLTTTAVDAFGDADHAASIAPNNLWFLIAMLVALLLMISNNNFRGVEGYIIISLGNGITLTMMGGITKLYPGKIRESCLSSFSRYIVWALWKGVSAVFWWRLLESSLKEDCGIFGWFFGRVGLLGLFRTFHKVFNIVEWTLWLLMMAPYPVGLVLLIYFLVSLDRTEFERGRRDGALMHTSLAEPPNKHTANLRAPVTTTTSVVAHEEVGREQLKIRLPSKLAIFCDCLFSPVGEIHDVVYGKDNRVSDARPSGAYSRRPEEHNQLAQPKGYQRALQRTHLQNFDFLVAWDVIVLIFTVCTIELSIILNNITEVNYLDSAGQLVAFVVGLGGSMTALGQYYVERRERTKVRGNVQGQGTVGDIEGFKHS
ncbi:hypothetical protein K440DRAFT_635450 [Wilcoxina mikolae CBS 423.85]|nr:hypothetical protein K440DRAFT_635450 [Wilcoxina mikolae CBS 423.85]